MSFRERAKTRRYFATDDLIFSILDDLYPLENQKHMSRDQIAFWQQVLALAYVRVTVSEGVPDTVQRLPPGMLRSVMVCADSEASFLREFRDREGLTHLETADIRQAFDHQCKAPARASRCSVAAGYTRGAWPLDRAIPCQHDR